MDKKRLCIFLIVFTLIISGCNKKDEEEVTFESDIAISEEIEDEEPKNINVDIKGQIKKPGVYSVLEGSTINDLIKLAGGINKNGTTENINLAKKVEDEMIVIIKTKAALAKYLKDNKESEPICATTNIDCSECLKNVSSSVIVNKEPSKESDSNDGITGKISINTATKEELMKLNGIGESKANTIIEYRNANGPFKNIEDLKNVSGIGDVAFEKIKDDITQIGRASCRERV